MDKRLMTAMMRSDATIPHFLTYKLILMAAHSMECEGEAHADDGAGEEAHKHHLLLHLDLSHWSIK